MDAFIFNSKSCDTTAAAAAAAATDVCIDIFDL